MKMSLHLYTLQISCRDNSYICFWLSQQIFSEVVAVLVWCSKTAKNVDLKTHKIKPSSEKEDFCKPGKIPSFAEKSKNRSNQEEF